MNDAESLNSASQQFEQWLQGQTWVLMGPGKGHCLWLGHKSPAGKEGRILKYFFCYSSIAVNLRLLVYRYGMQNSGNESSWNYMFKTYQETLLAQEKEKLLYGLASVMNITLLDRWFQCTRIILSLELNYSLFSLSFLLFAVHFCQITACRTQHILKNHYLTPSSETAL